MQAFRGLTLAESKKSALRNSRYILNIYNSYSLKEKTEVTDNKQRNWISVDPESGELIAVLFESEHTDKADLHDFISEQQAEGANVELCDTLKLYQLMLKGEVPSTTLTLEKNSRTVTTGEKISKFKGFAVPAWIKTEEGERYYYSAALYVDNIDEYFDIEQSDPAQLMIYPGLIYKRALLN
jgi:hypothetical protein